jgi:hypothetical protein
MNANEHPSNLLPYPLMAVMLAVAIILPMTIVAFVREMASNPWYWLLEGVIACGSQVSLIIVYRFDASTQRGQ